MTEFSTDTPISPSFDDELYQSSSQGLDVAEPKAEVIPAIEVALTGRHLIEASAGTGKTWTLTGIVLRLLIEARRAPEQIIATTFTRAAAAEMRQRIHDRLVDFYQLLQWVSSLSASPANKEHLYPSILQVTPDSDKDKKNSQVSQHADTDATAKKDADELNQDIAYDLSLIHISEPTRPY